MGTIGRLLLLKICFRLTHYKNTGAEHVCAKLVYFMNGFMYLYTNIDFGMNFHPFWCNPCKILAFYTPHNKIGFELNQ